MEMQLNIFCIWKLQKFEFAWKEFVLTNFLDSYKTDWSRIERYVHHAWCKWYVSWNQESTEYFLSEKERDERIEFLNEYWGTDKNWNNLKWYFPVWIFIQDSPEIVQSFWDEFIFWIWYIPNSNEKMLELAEEKAFFLKKQWKKTWQQSKKA